LHWLGSPGRKGWATIVQFVGAVVTFGGLGAAYMRARYGLTVKALAQRAWAFIRRQWAKLLRRPQDQIIKPGGAHSTVQFGTAAVGQVGFNLDTSLTVQEQLERLAQFVNHRSREAAQMESMIVALRQEVTKAHQHASDLASKTFAHIETQIQQLTDRLDKTQVLDLRWAIVGLAISAFGIALSYGT
jgi:hypothetical protein